MPLSIQMLHNYVKSKILKDNRRYAYVDLVQKRPFRRSRSTRDGAGDPEAEEGWVLCLQDRFPASLLSVVPVTSSSAFFSKFERP